MLAITGDVVIQSTAGVAVAGIGAWALVAQARRSKRTEEQTTEVKAQLLPNGGASLRDAIDRLDARSTEHDRRFGRIEHTLDGVATTLHRMEQRQTGDTGENPVV